MHLMKAAFATSLFILGVVGGESKADIDSLCEGYSISNVVENGFTISAHLDLIGKGCHVYGPDVPKLKLLVEYETGEHAN